MVKKVEHTEPKGDLAIAFSSLAQAADPATIGLAKTAQAALKAALKRLNGLTPQQRNICDQLTDLFITHFERSFLTEDRTKIVLQMLERFAPSESDLSAGNRDAATVALNMRTRLEKMDDLDPAYKNGYALADYAATLTATLVPFVEPQDRKDADPAEILHRTKALMTHVQNSGDITRLHNEGITENAIIRLAQRIAGETDDLGQAWLELQNAMDIALRVQQEWRTPSNHGGFVDEVLRRVADLAADGDYTDASARITEALARKEVESTARKTCLLDSGIEMALLDGNADSAARLLVQNADLEAGGQAEFSVLCGLQDTYFQRGRDKGIALDLKVALALARLVLTRAADADQRGAALNDLGTVLANLGIREAGTDRLEKAVTACRHALKEFPRDRVPLEWARTQMNLGIALEILGEREAGTDRLEKAVTAYRNALKEVTRGREPLEWAMAQMNLGNALQALGEREPGTDRLEKAVTAYRNALKERTHDRVPLEWATTQMNLGTALLALGEREAGTDRLEKAVTACRHALKEWTRDRVPLDWAMVQGNLSSLYLAFFDKTRLATHLDTAQSHLESAREVFDQAGASQYQQMAEALQAKIDQRLTRAKIVTIH